MKPYRDKNIEKGYNIVTIKEEDGHMTKIIDKIEQQIQQLPMHTVLPFFSLKTEGVSVDTLRKVLHRLHDRGVVTITSRGHFQREEPFSALVFVYGSLKKGFDNHHLLSKSAKRLGKAITIGKFGMFEDSFGNYPYLVSAPKMRIHGELYVIERKELLEKLDQFEGAPEYYERKKILVKSHHGTQRAYVYIQPHTSVPHDQKPLREWKNDSDYKMRKLDQYLETVIEA